MERLDSDRNIIVINGSPLIMYTGSFKSQFQDKYDSILVHNYGLYKSFHTHPFFEIVLIISGQARHRFNDTVYTMTAGDIIFMIPGDAHCFENHSSEIDLLSLQVSIDEMERFLTAYDMKKTMCGPQRTPAITLNPQITHELFQLGRQIHIRSEEERLEYYRILLGKILHCYLEHDTQEPVPIWLQVVMDEMTKLHNAAEGVPAMVRLSNFSHAQFCRLFKKHCGITPQQYVKNLRLNLARQMVESTKDDFMTISMNVGYNSFSHFCSSFKEKYGLSPSEMRKRVDRRFVADPDEKM